MEDIHLVEHSGIHIQRGTTDHRHHRRVRTEKDCKEENPLLVDLSAMLVENPDKPAGRCRVPAFLSVEPQGPAHRGHP